MWRSCWPTRRSPRLKARAENHLLGEPGVIPRRAGLARIHRWRFPKSPPAPRMLLPAAKTGIRRSIDHWLDTLHVQRRSSANSMVQSYFGSRGGEEDTVPVQRAFDEDVTRLYRCIVSIGWTAPIRRAVAATRSPVERRLRHPPVFAICETARHKVFGRVLTWRTGFSPTATSGDSPARRTRGRSTAARGARSGSLPSSARAPSVAASWQRSFVSIASSPQGSSIPWGTRSARAFRPALARIRGSCSSSGGPHAHLSPNDRANATDASVGETDAARDSDRSNHNFPQVAIPHPSG
jgi:hypothetical protein